MTPEYLLRSSCGSMLCSRQYFHPQITQITPNSEQNKGLNSVSSYRRNQRNLRMKFRSQNRGELKQVFTHPLLILNDGTPTLCVAIKRSCHRRRYFRHWSAMDRQPKLRWKSPSWCNRPSDSPAAPTVNTKPAAASCSTSRPASLQY